MRFLLRDSMSRRFVILTLFLIVMALPGGVILADDPEPGQPSSDGGGVGPRVHEVCTAYMWFDDLGGNTVDWGGATWCSVGVDSIFNTAL